MSIATDIQQLYIGYLGRAADQAGLAYWVDKVENGGWSVTDVALSFADQPEYDAIYGVNPNRVQLVALTYNQLFGRDFDNAGLQYWTEGGGARVPDNLLVEAFFNGASSADRLVVANKVEVSDYYTVKKGTPTSYNQADAREVIQGVTVNHDTVVEAKNTVDGIISTGNIFTLTESIVEGHDAVPAVTKVYWGYNPDVDGSGDLGTPATGGVPLEDMLNFLTAITGKDFYELGLVDDDGLGPFDNVTSLELEFNGEINADSSSNLVINYADGTSVNAEAVLGSEYLWFLSDLLFDPNGNTRLFEKVIVPAVEATEDTIQPIVLTTMVNNGGTMEAGYTSLYPDTIVAGRLELLHGAYIDAGSGYDILEVDAKGVYAQPKQLLNIEEIRVQNMANVYTTGLNVLQLDGSGGLKYYPGTSNPMPVLDENGYAVKLGEGYLNNSTYPLLSGDGIKTSFLDITRATSLEKLVVNEAYDFITDGSGTVPMAALTIVGIRNDAVTRLEGGFSRPVILQYGQGIDGTLELELALGDVTAPIMLLQNASVINIDSQGIENHMHLFFAGGSISRMYIEGTGVFAVDQNLVDSFNAGRPVIIDASANTGGLDITLTDGTGTNGSGDDGSGEADHGFSNVTVKGTQADDEITVTNITTSAITGKVVIAAGNGENTIVADSNDIVTITSGTGNDYISAQDINKLVTINAGDGDNVINADGAKNLDRVVNITSGAGNDTITAVRAGIVTINAGAGNNTITAAANELNITTGAGNDKLTISGMEVFFLNGDSNSETDNNGDDLINITEIGSPGAVLKIDVGAGNNTITLGRDVGTLPNGTQYGITALEGSSITGSNISLFVENNSHLAQATLAGITNVTLKQELTITDNQFKAIGASAFNVHRAAFGATENLHIIVDSNANLTDLLNGQTLSLNVRLTFELHNGATLTLTAQDLNDHVAVGGIDGADGLNGKVVITGAGANFDPFTNAGSLLIVDGGTIAPGNLYVAQDVTIIRDGVYERPVPGPLADIMTLGSATATAPLVISSPIITEAQTLNLIGSQDIQFKAVVDLGGEVNSDLTLTGKDKTDGQMVNGVVNAGTLETDGFQVQFSSLTGKVTGLTLDHFQDVKSIKGNGIAGTRIDVILNADVASSGVNKGLVTSGVETYMVTRIDTNQDGVPDGSGSIIFNLCDATQDVKFIGLKGNAGSTLILNDVPWGKVAPHIVLEGDGYANANEALKVDGSPNTSDVGNVTAIYNSTGAFAVVDINNGGVELGVTATGAERTFAVGTITLTNAASATINVKQGDVTIKAIDDGAATDTLTSVKFVATEDVTVTDTLLASLRTIDASGVVGAFTATLGDPGTHKFALTGGTGGVNLTLDGVNINHTTGLDDNGSSIDGGALGANLTIKTNSDLAFANLSHINKVTVANGQSVTLSLDQVVAIDIHDIVVDKVNSTATLNLVGLNDQPFSVANLTTGMSIGTVTLAAVPEITLHATTDLTGVSTLYVPDGTTLNLTAEQFQQLTSHTITGSGIVGTQGVVNITGLTQADINPLDLNGDGDYTDDGEHAGLDLSGITGVKFGTITLAESVKLLAADDFGSFKNIVMDDNMTLELADLSQGDALKISGGTNTTLKFNDQVSGAFESIDASGFAVTTLKMLNVLVDNRNVDLMFKGLPSAVIKVIYNGEGVVVGVDQTVTIEPATTVPGFVVFNKPEAGVEIQNFTLNLTGGTEITGNLRLSSSVKEDAAGNDLIQTHLKTVTINSTGTATNLLTGETENIITGDITSQGTGLQFSTPPYTSVDNNLLNLTINASQALVVEGSVIFESVTGDDLVFANDDDAAIATLTVTGTSDVTLGGLDTSDNDVDGLNVVNNGTGTLSLTLNAAELDQVTTVPVNNDALSFTGTGDIDLTIIGAVNLSDDVLTAVDQITLGNGSSTTPLAGEVVLTQAQFNALGAANLLDDGQAASTATLRLVEFGSAPFDVTALASTINVASITVSAGTVTLDPTTNLTGVDQIIVPEGSTLTLTAAQFQQLQGKGTIVGLDSDGLNGVGAFTVNITDLKQADVERAIDPAIPGDTAGFDLTGITGGTALNAPVINISLSEASVTMGKFDSLGALTLASNLGVITNQITNFILADNQTLGFVNSTQADGRGVVGGTNSTLMLQFDAMDAGDVNGINAAGYLVTTLKALATFVDNQDIEFLLLNVASSIHEHYYTDPLELGLVKATNRIALVEAGVEVPGYIMYNDPQTTQEVRNLDLTLSGGSKISGDVNLSTIVKSGTLTTQFFDTLTLHSVGTAANTITGNILATGADISPNVVEVENNLLKVVIDATQALNIGGDLVFTQQNAATTATTANLTLTGTANVTVEQLNVSDTLVTALNIANNGTGTFTVTGASPALFDGDADGTYTVDTTANLESLVLSGSGNIILGTSPDPLVVTEWGITAKNLSVINASALTGNLDLGVVKDVDSQNFAFTSGTGVTKLTVSNDTVDMDTLDNIADSGWSFDFTNAAAGSEFHLGAGMVYGNNATDHATMQTTSDKLDIKLGANTTLYIDADTDFTNMDIVTISGAKNIILAKGVDLTMTAAQASGLHIVPAADVITDPLNPLYVAADVPQVHLTNLGTAVYDLSGIAEPIAGEATLTLPLTGVADVTLAPTTDLGFFTVQLLAFSTSDATLAGQTIRFNTVAQADNAVSVVFPDGTLGAPDGHLDPLGGTGNSSANVVWLFNSIAAPVDTSNYDPELGRLLFSATLVNSYGGLVENMFTTLPGTILRVDFATVTALNILLSSDVIDRTMEFSNFTSVGNLTFSDIGLTPVEHLHSLDLVLGGQVVIGNVQIDDVVGAPGYDPASISFDHLTIDSHLALTGRTSVSTSLPGGNPNPNHLASEAFVNNNNGTNTTGETAQPNNINTVGNIGVGTGLNLLTVNLNTYGVSVIGDTSAGDGAALQVGTGAAGTNGITYGYVPTVAVPTATARLNVTGDNNINISSVNTADADITALTVTTTGFTGVLTAPGTSPALQMNATQTLTFANDGGAPEYEKFYLNLDTDLVVSGAGDSITFNGTTVALAAADTDVDVKTKLIAASYADWTAFDTGILGEVGFIAKSLATTTNVTLADFTFTDVVGDNTDFTADVTLGQDGGLDGTITLGSGTTNAGVAGNELSFINAANFDGTLNLGILALIDSTNDTANLNNDNDMDDAGEIRAFTFTSGQGITTATLAAANGFTPILNAGSEWSFNYTGADAGSYLKITPTATLTAGSTLRLTNVPLQIEGAVSLTHLIDDPATLTYTEGLIITGGSINVLTGSTLTLTVAQVVTLNTAGVQIFGAGTIKVTGDATGLTLGANLHTVNVDISGVTFDSLLDTDVDLTVTGAILDISAPTALVGQNVVGSALVDTITTGNDLNDTISGGLGDDFLNGGTDTGAPLGDDHNTYLVTAGTDTITGLKIGDVMVVSAGATADAGVITALPVPAYTVTDFGFVATAATVNNGTVNLTGGVADDTTIDMHLATGSNGFTLAGGTSATVGTDTLIGSNQADIINGGNSSQTALAAADVLTGHAGNDKFVFDTTISTPAVPTETVTVVGIDRELINLTQDGVDNENEHIIIGYSLNGGVTAFIDINLSAIDPTVLADVTSEVTNAMEGIVGISATGNGATGVVTLSGDSGNGVTLVSASYAGTIGGATTLNAGFANGTDVAQQVTLDISAPVVANEKFVVTVTEASGASTTAAPYFAIDTPLDDNTDVAAGVTARVNAAMGLTTVNAVNVPGASLITFIDENADNGSFVLSHAFSGATTGSGASALLASGAITTLLGACSDIITDFAAGDTISLHSEAGSLANYAEAAGVATFALALADANTAFASGAKYYLTSVTDDIPGTLDLNEATGLLFFNADSDGKADGVISLTGIDSDHFAYTNIVA